MWLLIILILVAIVAYFLFRSGNSNGSSSVIQSTFESMNKKLFPNGEQDKQDGASKLLLILNNAITREEALDIFVRASAISVLSEKFDKERLRAHLDGRCKGVFSEEQLQQFHSYLIARLVAISTGTNQ